MVVDKIEREQDVLQLLNNWPWDLGGVIMGGYAICAYGKPRYSDDIDIVIPNNCSNEIINWLENKKFVTDNHNIPNPQNCDGQTYRFSNDNIKLVLLIGFVRDREAKVDIPEEWITKDSKRYRLFLLTGSTKIPVPVARPEALWALKLQAGRDQDITDLFAIRKTKVASEEVKALFLGFPSRTLMSKLIQTIKKTHEAKIYKDAMSRLAIKQNDESKNEWTKFQNKIEEMIPYSG